MRIFKKNYSIIAVFFTVLCAGLLLQGFLGMLGTENPYNTYALQAERWIEGHLDLGQNYAHLEIAEYGGKFYASFPPFPSVFLLPFTIFFGTNTPDALISIFVAAAGAVCAYSLARAYGQTEKNAIFWSLFVTIGSNFLTIFFEGWVWFFAQTLSFSLSMAALLAAKCKRPTCAFLFWAFAVGCRPFQILYLPLLVLILHQNGMKTKSLVRPFLPAAAVGIFYALLNVLRFGNPLEFGHNFLPEFQAQAQFSLSYIPYNLQRLLRLPALVNGYLQFPEFDGFAFYLASPIFIVFLLLFFRRGRKKADFLVLFLCLLHLLLLAAHRTLGGWQFGCRYTVDLLPFILFSIVSASEKNAFPLLPRILCLGGLLLNTAGVLAIFG